MKNHVPKIEFRHVDLAFGDKVVLEGACFHVDHGEMKVVLGQSGSGKSTILRLLLGLLKPDGGEILIDGRNIAPLTEEELNPLRRHMSIVFQEGALFDSLSVYDNIAWRPRELGWPEERIAARAAEVLDMAGLGAAADLLPAELSGGERRMVAIARAMVDDPEIILFDEPTVGLDPPTSRRVCDAAIRLRDLREVTSLFVTHRLSDVRYLSSRYATAPDGPRDGQPSSSGRSGIREEGAGLCLINTKFIVLNHGRVVFDGTDEQLWAAEDTFLHSFTHDDDDMTEAAG
ncbi:MAG: ABC transporter ATP-binding protein [Blastocatellia bacterium]